MDKIKSVSEFNNALDNHNWIHVLAYDNNKNNRKNNQFENLRKLLVECKKRVLMKSNTNIKMNYA